jgi:hypothetical protein
VTNHRGTEAQRRQHRVKKRQKTHEESKGYGFLTFFDTPR